jgi:predicted house-cleaning noncanonical NTP pyrophosphatase (MazG superfamily)
MAEKTNLSYNKLVRDKIPEIIKASNRTPKCKVLDDDQEYLRYLIEKLHEEVLEFTENPCVEELADVREVVDALSGIKAFEDVVSVQERKKEEKKKTQHDFLPNGSTVHMAKLNNYNFTIPLFAGKGKAAAPRPLWAQKKRGRQDSCLAFQLFIYEDIFSAVPP